MSIKSSTICAVGAIAGAAMLGLSISPASAFTLSGPSLERPVAFAQIDKVWWRGGGWGWRGGGWRGGWGRGPGWGYRGYGWGPAAVVGGLAAGAIVGSALAAPYYYGPGPGYYGAGPAYDGRPVYDGRRNCSAGFDGVVHCSN